jgi:membrane protein DedA with SNARE-associated domain
MAGMDRRKFLAANIASAFVWAPAHIVPAQFAGISLEHLRNGDWRGAAVFIALLAVAGGGLWVVHRWAAGQRLLARSRD